MLIVKYFGDDALSFVEKGSFRFGTLLKYRKAEGAAAEDRFSDEREGLLQREVTSDSGFIEYVRTPNGGTYSNCFFGGNAGGDILLTSSINEYIFCASTGPYAQHHHRQMLFGSAAAGGKVYQGNPTLFNYAVIDLSQFLDGISKEMAAKLSMERRYCRHNLIRHDLVGYGDPRVHYSGPRHSFSQKISDTEYLPTLFVKAMRFSPEKEYRIVAKINPTGFISADSVPVSFINPTLRRSVVEIGRFEG